MGIILNIVASILGLIFKPFIFLYTLSAIKNLDEWNKYNFDVAIGKDQLDNVRAQYLLNSILIKPEGYRFGKVDETISSVIGKNKREKTLTLCGRILDFILDKLDKDHSIKSIEEDE